MKFRTYLFLGIFAMSSPSSITLHSLSEYGAYYQHPEASAHRALLKRVLGLDKRPMLMAVREDDLSILDRVRVFFGVGDFRLKTVQRLADEAIQTLNSLPSDETKGFDVENIQRGVLKLNDGIEKHDRKRLFKVLYRSEIPKVSSVLISALQKTSELSSSPILASKAPPKAVSAIADQHHLERLLKIPGLRNPSCLCYCNSSIIALYSSPAFRKKLINENHPLAVALKNVFQYLDTPGEPLSHFIGPLHELNVQFRRFFPAIAEYWVQQDAQEFVGPMLERLFQSSSPTFSVVPRVTRENKKPIATNKSSNELPSIDEMYIPSIDKEIRSNDPDYQTNMIQVKIPQGSKEFAMSSFFEGFEQQENVEVDAIIGNEKNASWMTDHKAALLLSMAGRSGRLTPIPVHVQYHIEGTTPTVLPVYIPRFTERGEKNFTPVHAPYSLRVPVEKKGKKERIQRYVLRSVSVHSGGDKGTGHYYTYIPDPSEIDNKGNPTRWVVASDSSPKSVHSWDDVKNDIERNGVMFIYDKVETSS